MRKQSASLGAWPGGRVLVLSPTPTHPQDYGNRKRIFEVCSRFADEGAHMTYLHYPAEFEWRGAVPRGAERAMKQAWDQYYTVAPTRSLHDRPSGDYHRIDEWWDEAIGHFLRWLFSVQSFDVFIVNYSWLSRAFEYAPPWTFKILDTHDKVSGRREMLLALGIEPEFFYTAEDEERVALQRADLVWAIKDEERAQFERMSSTPVLTLPHLDAARVLGRPAADPAGFLRVGIIGARNNVNRMNIVEFLKAAEPVFLETFAPIRVSIAGSVCDLLDDLHYPFVELRGRIENVEDFYRCIDCVVVPVRASTGLKIKTGEALSLGWPLVSLAHAFEGYEPSHPLHRLDNFPQMARALIDLAFGPRSDLESLAEASRTSYAKTNTLIADSFRSSDERARKGARSIVLSVDSRAFVAGSVFNLALMPMQDYLRDLANVTVLVVRGSARDVLANPQAVARLRRVVVADNVTGAAEVREALAAMQADVFGLEEYLDRARPKIVIADALHPALKHGLTHATLILRAEMIAHSQGDADFVLPARSWRRAFMAAPGMSREMVSLADSTGAVPLPAPCFVCRRETGIPVASARRDATAIAVLGTRDAPAVRMAVAMIRARGMQPHVVHGFGDEAMESSNGDATPAARADEYIASMLAGRLPAPHAAIDLSAGRLGIALCREVLELMHVPVMTASTGALHGSLGLEAVPHRIATERALWTAVRSIAEEFDVLVERNFDKTWSLIDSNREWPWLQRTSFKLFTA